MKRIEFVAPVEAMRGNLSGNQNLVYPLDNNAAFDAPSGRRSYARNYGTRYIGAKRASTGLKYFGVKTKSAVYLSTKTRKVMALLGGTGAVRAKLMKEQPFYENTLVKAYEYARTSGAIESNVTIDKWLFDLIYEVLKAKGAVFMFKTAQGAATYRKNPWVESNAAGAAVNIGMAILVKFWNQLAANPINFEVDGLKGIAHAGDKFADVQDKNYNNLGIDTKSLPISGDEYMVIGDQWIMAVDPTAVSEPTYVDRDTDVKTPDEMLYVLTDVAPEDN